MNFTFNYSYYIFAWILINGIIAYKAKRGLAPYYRKTKGKIKDGEKTLEIENIHEYYPEFAKYGKEPSFFSLWIAFVTYFWIRSLIWLSLLVFTYLECK